MAVEVVLVMHEIQLVMTTAVLSWLGRTMMGRSVGHVQQTTAPALSLDVWPGVRPFPVSRHWAYGLQCKQTFLVDNMGYTKSVPGYVAFVHWPSDEQLFANPTASILRISDCTGHNVTREEAPVARAGLEAGLLNINQKTRLHHDSRSPCGELSSPRYKVSIFE